MADVGKISASPHHQVVSEWSLLNVFVSNKIKIFQQVGFLAIDPHPVIKYIALYKFLQNSLNILGRKDQNNFTIFCDGVYPVARGILLKKPGEFKAPILCLVSFHLKKMFLPCIKKYLKGRACHTVWVKNKVFRLKLWIRF